MEALIRYVLMRYGEAALGWTIRQLVERLSADGQPPEGCGTDLCVRVQQLQKQGYNLDPDCGVYFWELPTREQ